MECCWKRDSSRCFLRRRDCVPDGVRLARLHEQVGFCWCGNASASTWNLAWQKSWEAIRNGEISRRWTSITRMGRCQRGSAGTCNIGRPGSKRRRRLGNWRRGWAWPGSWFLPARCWRIVCFCIITPWQVGIILSANYTFLNYLVLVLGFLLLDDKLLQRFLPERWRSKFLAVKRAKLAAEAGAEAGWKSTLRKQ